MDRLSKLQRLILISLLDESNLIKDQRARNVEIYRTFFDCGDYPQYIPAARASLSRAYRRLENRGLIRRIRGAWYLNDEDLTKNGALVAGLEYLRLVEEMEALNLPGNIRTVSAKRS
jgi:hypothetical protein